jgi:lipoprotein
MKKIAVLLLLVAGMLTACNTSNNSKTIEPSSLLGVWENTAIKLPNGQKQEMPLKLTDSVEVRMYRCFCADHTMPQAFRITGIPQHNKLYQTQLKNLSNATYSISGNAITITFDTNGGKISQTGTLQITGDTAVLITSTPNVGTTTIWMKKVSSPTEADIINAPLMDLENLLSEF